MENITEEQIEVSHTSINTNNHAVNDNGLNIITTNLTSITSVSNLSDNSISFNVNSRVVEFSVYATVGIGVSSLFYCGYNQPIEEENINWTKEGF